MLRCAREPYRSPLPQPTDKSDDPCLLSVSEVWTWMEVAKPPEQSSVANCSANNDMTHH